MQDLEIKGTGNSRYIKSSVPATTTWDDFLTMLRAGNLPIDLMGLNTSGIITQSPSAYNKANVLPDDVCELMSLDTISSEPDDAFRYLALMQASVYGKIVVTAKSNGLPVEGLPFKIGATNVVTDSDGHGTAILPPGNYTATFSSTLDLTVSPASMQVVSRKGEITYYDVTATILIDTEQTFTSSRNISFSARVRDFDIFCVGGGGSGGAAVAFDHSPNDSIRAAAAGGAGGFTATAKNITNTGKIISLVVGSGGNSSNASLSGSLSDTIGDEEPGKNGGETYASVDGSKICSALGGNGGNANTTSGYLSLSGASGGSGSGDVLVQNIRNSPPSVGNSGSNGADGQNSSNNGSGSGKGQGSTTRYFGESTGTAYSPAGAGCGFQSSGGSTDKGQAGALGGSSDVYMTSSSANATATASAGRVAGAGGGAAIAASNINKSVSSSNIRATSGAGKAGLIIVRWRYN